MWSPLECKFKAYAQEQENAFMIDKILIVLNKFRRLTQRVNFRSIQFMRSLFYDAYNSYEKIFGKQMTFPILDSIHPIYINLDTRIDRKKHIEEELKRIGFQRMVRFPAIENKLGILGCTLSHKKLVETAIFNSEEAIFVVEDDAKFICSKRLLENILKDFLENSIADVLCIGNNVQDYPTRFSNYLLRTQDTQTTSCYFMKKTIFPEYLQILNKGIDLMNRGFIAEGAIDIIWKELQTSHVFVIPRKRILIQIASYSDIANEKVRYLA